MVVSSRAIRRVTSDHHATRSETRADGSFVWNDFYGGDKGDSHAYVALTQARSASRASGTRRDVVLAGTFVHDAHFVTGKKKDTSSYNEGPAVVMRVAP